MEIYHVEEEKETKPNPTRTCTTNKLEIYHVKEEQEIQPNTTQYNPTQLNSI